MLAYIDGKTSFSASCMRFMASYWFATTARMQILAEVSEVTLTIFRQESYREVADTMSHSMYSIINLISLVSFLVVQTSIILSY